MSKYSSDKEMQKLFEGFRSTINEAPTPTPEKQAQLDQMGTAVDKDGSSAPPSNLDDFTTAVDKDGSSTPPSNLDDFTTAVDKEGDSAMTQKKAKAFDQVEGALKQLLKKIQDAGL